jgi:hypothetical protein
MISFEQYSKFLNKSVRRVEAEKIRALARLGDHAQVMAVEYFGREMPGWAPLSEATMKGFEHPYGFWIKGKEELGYTGQVSSTDPLLRTGKTRDSVRAESDDREMILGSDEKVMLFQELGTHNPLTGDIPPRPVLALAMQNAAPYSEIVFGEAAVSLLVPQGAR